MSVIDESRLDGARDEVRRLTTAWLDEGRYTPRSDSWLRSFDRAFSKEQIGRAHV